MRTLRLVPRVVGALFVVACREGARPTSAAAPTAASATATASAAASASPSAPSTGPAGHGPAPLFWYREGDDTLAFWSPDVVVLTRTSDGGARTCRSTLPGDVHGNVYSGREVEAAFRDPDVQKILAGPHLTPYSSSTDGTLGLGTGGDPITWTRECDKCFGDAGALLRLHEVLRVVMRNRRLLCK